MGATLIQVLGLGEVQTVVGSVGLEHVAGDEVRAALLGRVRVGHHCRRHVDAPVRVGADCARPDRNGVLGRVLRGLVERAESLHRREAPYFLEHDGLADPVLNDHEPVGLPHETLQRCVEQNAQIRDRVVGEAHDDHCAVDYHHDAIRVVERPHPEALNVALWQCHGDLGEAGSGADEAAARGDVDAPRVLLGRKDSDIRATVHAADQRDESVNHFRASRFPCKRSDL